MTASGDSTSSFFVAADHILLRNPPLLLERYVPLMPTMSFAGACANTMDARLPDDVRLEFDVDL